MASLEDEGARRDIMSPPERSRWVRSWKALAHLAMTGRGVRPSAANLKDSNRSEQTARAQKVDGKRMLLSYWINRAYARFREIARRDGWVAASMWAARRLRYKLERYRPFSVMSLLTGRCRYYTPPKKSDPYDAWLRVNQDNPRRRLRIECALSPPSADLRFSIVVPVYNPPAEEFRAMIRSVIDQTIPGWELILVDDASPDPRVRQEMDVWADRDARIRAIYRLENGNISVATNSRRRCGSGRIPRLPGPRRPARARCAGPFARCISTRIRTPTCSTATTIRSGPDGRRHSPQFKPDWSPELLLSFCYTGHLTAVRRHLYHEVGGMRHGIRGLARPRFLAPRRRASTSSRTCASDPLPLASPFRVRPH